MILSNRQEKKINQIIDEFKEAAKHNGFRYDGQKLYYDAEKGLVILATHYKRTLVNLLDEDIAMTIVDRNGTIRPLSHVIKFAKDRLEYLSKIKIIKEY
jgi:K+-transporting ATPase A subunit